MVGLGECENFNDSDILPIEINKKASLAYTKVKKNIIIVLKNCY